MSYSCCYFSCWRYVVKIAQWSTKPVSVVLLAAIYSHSTFIKLLWDWSLEMKVLHKQCLGLIGHYFFIILATLDDQKLPNSYFYQSRFKILPFSKLILQNLTKSLKFCQSGEIFRNLVTLLGHLVTPGSVIHFSDNIKAVFHKWTNSTFFDVWGLRSANWITEIVEKVELENKHLLFNIIAIVTNKTKFDFD